MQDYYDDYSVDAVCHDAHELPEGSRPVYPEIYQRVRAHGGSNTQCAIASCLVHRWRFADNRPVSLCDIAVAMWGPRGQAGRIKTAVRWLVQHQYAERCGSDSHGRPMYRCVIDHLLPTGMREAMLLTQDDSPEVRDTLLADWQPSDGDSPHAIDAAVARARASYGATR